MKKDIESNSRAYHLESIIDSINDAVILADGHGQILSWNAAASRMFQYKLDEAKGQPLSLIVPDRYKEAHDTGIQRVLAGGEQRVIGKTVELQGLRKDGTEFPIELSLSLSQEDGQFFLGGIIRDCTERKKSEEALSEAEQRFRSITESANDAIISADEKGLIIFWNQTAHKLFGYTEEEALGKPLTIIVPDQYKQLHEAGIQRVSTGGDMHVIGKTVELEGLHKEGHVFPIELSLSTWENSGKRYYSGIIRDITERKKSEREILDSRSELAEKALKLKDALEEINVKNEQLQDLSNKLAKYLSQQVYKSIFQGTKEVKIESYRKNLTIFFSDIQGFTELTDRVESEVLTNILNKYLNEMSKIAVEFGGTIDKFIGDAIMIFFGDPETGGEKHDAIACVKMAIKMRERMSELTKEWDDLGIIRPIQIRIGINSGFATVGNFGSEDRLDYTIVGGNVNLASRLESAAAPDSILISHSTFSLVKDEILCVEREEVTAKGLAYPVRTYEVINAIAEANALDNSLQTALEGFNLNIDFNRLSYTARLEAKDILEKAISKLR